MSVKSANEELNEFKDLMRDGETTNILEHAKQRRKDDPKGIKPWQAQDHPDWLAPEP
jgi:hypothetical protein